MSTDTARLLKRKSIMGAKPRLRKSVLLDQPRSPVSNLKKAFFRSTLDPVESVLQSNPSIAASMYRDDKSAPRAKVPPIFGLQKASLSKKES